MCTMTSDESNNNEVKSSDGEVVLPTRPTRPPHEPNISGTDHGTEGCGTADDSQPSGDGKVAASSKEGNEADAVNSLLSLVCTGAQEESAEELAPAARIDGARNQPEDGVAEAEDGAAEAEDGSHKQVLVAMTPETKDVLCGRGRGYFNHPGNRRMLDIVNQNKGRYKAAGKTMKTVIVKDVTDLIQAGGTRFLKLADSQWYEVTALEAHKKVCHCLREEKNNLEAGFESPESRKMKQIEMVDHLKQVKEELLMNGGGGNNNEGSSEPRKKKQKKSKKKKRKKNRRSPSPSSSRSSSSSSSSSSDSASETEEKSRPSSGFRGQEQQGMMGDPRQQNQSNPFFSSFLGRPSGIAADMATSSMPSAALSSMPAAALSGDTPLIDRPPQDETRMGNFAARAAAAAAASESATAMDTSMGLRGFQNSQNGMVIGDPSPLDVLLGVDPMLATTSGNIRMRQMIRAAVGYSVTSVEDKLLVARGIVGQLKLGGARFLTRQNNGPPGIWFIVADMEAEALIFRYLCDEENTTKAAMLRVKGFTDNPPAPAGLLGSTNHLASAGAAPLSMGSSNPLAAGASSQMSFSAGAGNAFGSGLGNSQRGSMRLRAEQEAFRKKRADEHETTMSIYEAAANPNLNPRDITKKRKVEEMANSASHLHNGPSSFLRPGAYQPNETPFGGQFGVGGAFSVMAAGIGGGHMMATAGGGGIPMMAAGGTGGDIRSNSVNRNVVLGPGPHDVVCGRGRGSFSQLGNRSLLKMFHENKDRYQAATKAQKTIIAREIVDGIQSRGGRFLKRTDDGDWFIVPDNQAYRKVCHGIRDILKGKDDVDGEKKMADGGGGDDDNESTDSGSSKSSDGEEKMSSTSNQLSSAFKKTQQKTFEAPKDNIHDPSASRQQPQATAALESDSEEHDGIEPRPGDVVCGRGRGNFSHPGNRRMLNIIHQHKERYRSAPTKAEKAEISREVMANILSNGARFLKRTPPDSDYFVELEFKDALKKVCHGIRDSLCNGVKGKIKEKRAAKKAEKEQKKVGEKKKKGAKSDTLSGSGSSASHHGQQQAINSQHQAFISGNSFPPSSAAAGGGGGPSTSSAMNHMAGGMNGYPVAGGGSFDPLYMRKLQAERSAAVAAGIPMHVLLAAQQASAATGRSVEEILIAEKRNGNIQCVIS